MRAGRLSILIVLVGAHAALAGAEATRAAPAPAMTAPEAPARGFADWVAAFRPRALAAGIRADTFDAAFAGIEFDPAIVEKDRNQGEFSKQIWDYLDTAVSAERVKNGQAALARHRRLLDEIEARYGVEAEVVTAIWGLESAYGSFRGTTPVIRALATLAYEGRRAGFFEKQLLAALSILEGGHARPPDFTGSWAGASGHTQFMPSSFLDYAQDFRGDGRRDLWSDDPTDALASTANYLRAHGWTRGQPWGMEVVLPEGFDFTQTGERIKKPAAAWTAAGVRDIDGREIPGHGPASILLPAGHQGAAFIIFDNFHVLERYNTADAYVIAVGHLADRLRGGAPIRHGWPRQDRALSGAEKREMQALLTDRGFDPGGVDGIMGPNTIQAVRGFQGSLGLVQDGYGSLAILERLRAN